MKNKILMTVGLAILATGCETLDPYTGESGMSQSTKGALIGAGIGVVAGLASGDDAVDRRQRAMIGAGIGALAGGSVGYYMDKQEAELRAELQNTGVSVTRDGDNITLNMPGNVTFATDSSDLNPAFFDVLRSVGKVVKEFDQTVVEVAGHTDSTGSESYNQALSERRASTVAQYLQSRGVAEVRMITIGMGEAMPIADNSSAAGRQANRRVELTLVPLTSGWLLIGSGYQKRDSGTWIEDSGIVVRLLHDDNDESQHQRIIVQLRDRATLLLAHNLDLAARLPVGIGDRLKFRGMYEWNDLGGLVHWTHHDPHGVEAGGWIKLGRKTYA